MLKKTNYIILFLILCFLHLQLKAQDIYLSHREDAPQYLNPALTGMYFGKRLDYRYNINIATQSIGGFSNLYKTAAIGYDRRINRFGLGGYLIGSQSGEVSYNVLNLFLSGAYEVAVDPTYRHNLVTGIQIGMFQNSFDQGKVMFGNQYNPSSGTFDQNYGVSENLERSNIIKFDAGIGSFYSFRDRYKILNPFLGFSIFHATNPNISFYNDEIKYPVRFSVYGGTGLNFSEFFQVTPTIYILNQAKNTMLDLGVLGFYQIKNSRNELIMGILSNTNDILTIHAGLKLGDNVYRISYGINSPFMKTLNSSRSDIEFSAILSKKSNIRPSYYN